MTGVLYSIPIPIARTFFDAPDLTRAALACAGRSVKRTTALHTSRYPIIIYGQESSRRKESRMRGLIVILSVLVLGQQPDQSLAPWGSNHHPTDVAKRHVEQIAAGRHVYTVRQGGTMDGTNCRSPLGVGMMDGPAIKQIWESNRGVRLENVGETDVINPWLSNGRSSFRTLSEIVSS